MRLYGGFRIEGELRYYVDCIWFMKKINYNGYFIELYDSIDEMLIKRFNLY